MTTSNDNIRLPHVRYLVCAAALMGFGLGIVAAIALYSLHVLP